MENKNISIQEAKELLQEKSYLTKFIEDLKLKTMNEVLELESAIENEKNNRLLLNI